MKLKNCFYVFLSSVVLCFALTPLGGYPGFRIKLLAAAFLYFALSRYIFEKWPLQKDKVLTTFLIILPPLLLYGSIHLANYQATELAFPSSVAHLVGVLFALLTTRTQRMYNAIIVVLFFSLSLLAAYPGYTMWMNKVNYGTLTSRVNEDLPAPLAGRLQNNGKFDSSDYKGKILVIDFWHTQCAACFLKFPEVQRVYDRFKGNSSFALLAVNKPLTSDSKNKAFSMLKTRGYSFPALIPYEFGLSEKFGVTSFPTTLIVDKEGRIIFRGDIKVAEELIEELLSIGI